MSYPPVSVLLNRCMNTALCASVCARAVADSPTRQVCPAFICDHLRMCTPASLHKAWGGGFIRELHKSLCDWHRLRACWQSFPLGFWVLGLSRSTHTVGALHPFQHLVLFDRSALLTASQRLPHFMCPCVHPLFLGHPTI